MYRSKSKRPAAVLACLFLCLLGCAVAADDDAKADDPGADDPMVHDPRAAGEAYLVTYGPGEIYWQRFGHNAIWLIEPGSQLDHTFNFGFFDFAQEHFLWRFVQGRMLYFSAAQPSVREFGQYRSENRGIGVQLLDLTAEQYLVLRNTLLREIRPENRDYLYDYYDNNCSTRVRDVLDKALGGALSGATRSLPAQQNQRAHTRRLTTMDFWLYLGLEAALGQPVDRPVSRWDEMFLPSVVSDSLRVDGVVNLETGRPVVSSEEILFRSTSAAPPATPGQRWPVYLLLSAALVLLLSASARLLPPVWGNGLAMAWMLTGGIAGLFLVFTWFFTDHEVASWNANLLLLHPLMLLVILPAMRKAVILLTGAAGLLAVALQVFPGHQYTADVVAAVLPLSFAAGLRIWSRGPLGKSGAGGFRGG